MRKLPEADYANLQNLYNFIYLFNVPLFVIPNAISFFITQFQKDNTLTHLPLFYEKISALFLKIVLGFLALFLLVSPLILWFLELPNPTDYVILGIFLSTIPLVAINRGILQGNMRFRAFALSFIAEASLRVIFVIILLQFAVTGAMLATLLAGIITLLITLLPALQSIYSPLSQNESNRSINNSPLSQSESNGSINSKGLINNSPLSQRGPRGLQKIPHHLSLLPKLKNIITHLKKQPSSKNTNVSLKPLGRYLLPVTIAYTFHALFYTSDVAIVKHFYHEDTTLTALYASLSLMGKIILWLLTPIVMVLFPFSAQVRENVSLSLSVLFKAITIVGILGIPAITIYILFPEIITIPFPMYKASIPYLGITAIWMFLLALTYTVMNYHLAIKNTNIYLLLLLACLTQIITLWFYHPSITAILTIVTTIQAMVLLLLVIYTIIYVKQQKALR